MDRKPEVFQNDLNRQILGRPKPFDSTLYDQVWISGLRFRAAYREFFMPAPVLIASAGAWMP